MSQNQCENASDDENDRHREAKIANLQQELEEGKFHRRLREQEPRISIIALKKVFSEGVLKNWAKIWLLLQFFFFNVFLVFTDIVMDTWNGVDLVKKGHTYWGCCTLALQFGPFLGAIVMAFYVTSTQRPVAQDEVEIRALGKDHEILQIKTELGLQRSEAINNQWILAFMHFPYVQPFRNIYLLLKLLIIDIEDTSTQANIEQIKREGAACGFLEAFLESGPQLILQISIIIRFGYITFAQAMSMPFSLLSLSYAALRAYFLQRVRNESDPDPPLTAKILPLILCFLFLTSMFSVCWAFLFAYMRGLAFFMVLVSILTNYVLVFHCNLDNIRRYVESTKTQVTQYEKQEIKKLRIAACFTSLLSPCIVGHFRTNLLVLTGCTSVMYLMVWLVVTLIFRSYVPLDIDNNPPITYCLTANDTHTKGQICLMNETTLAVLDCGQPYLRLCSGTDCLPSVRFCKHNEHSMEMFAVLSTILGTFLAFCAAAIVFIQWLSDYYNFLVFTNWMTKGQGIIHRSLVCSFIKYFDLEGLEKCLLMVAEGKDLSEQISKADIFGKTPLHFTIENLYLCNNNCRMMFLDILLKHQAKLNTKDQKGRTPLHCYIGRFRCDRDVCRALISAGSSLYVQDGLNEGLLHTAVSNINMNPNHLDIIDLLLEEGAPIDLINTNGRTPLGELIWSYVYTRDFSYNNLLIPKMLLQAGADVNYRDPNGKTYLHLAVSSGNIELLKLFLEETKISVNQVDSQKQGPLHVAIQSDFGEGVELLLAKGANPDQLDRENQTPLHHAAHQRNCRMTEMLLKNWASVNMQSKTLNFTPLHVAIDEGNIDVAKLILASKPNVELRDLHGMTPLHLCMSARIDKVCEIFVCLLKNGASMEGMDFFLPDKKSLDDIEVATHKVGLKIRNALSLVKMHRKKCPTCVESEYLQLLANNGFTLDASEAYLKWWIQNRQEHGNWIPFCDRKRLQEASCIVNWHPTTVDTGGTPFEF